MGSKQALKYGKVTVADLLETEASRASFLQVLRVWYIRFLHYPLPLTLVLEAFMHYGR